MTEELLVHLEAGCFFQGVMLPSGAQKFPHLTTDSMHTVPPNSYRTSRHFENQKVMLASPMHGYKDS